MVTIPRSEYEELKAHVTELTTHVAELTQQVNWLTESTRLARHQRFAPSSEKGGYGQLSFFNEAEATVDEETAKEPEPELIEVEKHYRKAKRKAEDRLPPDLPVETIEYALPEEEQVCPECGEPLHVIGRETRRELKLVPASATIVEHVRLVYGCRGCENNAESATIVKAPTPEPVMKGSFAAPEAVAQVMVQKYVNGVPLYRQEQDFNRNGIQLSRQTMANWIVKCALNWLIVIYVALRSNLLGRFVLHADETTIQVLHEPGKTPQSQSYMWLYRTSGDTDQPIAILEYQPDRKSARPEAFLKEFSGYLHADGYAGYHNLPDRIVVVGCWSHARRKFEDAITALPKNERDGSLAHKGRHYCDKLFLIERQLAKCSPEERYIRRQELAAPVIANFYAWLESLNYSTKTVLGKAVHYALEQRKYLQNYLLDGRLELSNNRAERTFKPFVIDRKNFLFCNTQSGAEASAVTFSIIATAIENGLNPFAYLTYIFKNAPNWDIQNDPEALDRLMPWNAPDSCKSRAR